MQGDQSSKVWKGKSFKFYIKEILRSFVKGGGGKMKNTKLGWASFGVFPCLCGLKSCTSCYLVVMYCNN